MALRCAASGHQQAADGSVHEAVAAAVGVVRDSGLPNRTSTMFTDIIDSEHGWHGTRKLGHPVFLDENIAYVHAYLTAVGTDL